MLYFTRVESVGVSGP